MILANICYYISDYGYGHASRSIAIVRALQAHYKVKIYLKTDFPLEFLENSLLQRNVEVIRNRNDFGVLFSGNKVDKKRTHEILDRWIASWHSYLQEEKVFCKKYNIDLILSDVPPQPLLLADELGINSIVISNFTWFYIYQHLFGANDAVLKLREAYGLANLTLVLPFNESMTYMNNKKEVGLVSRNISTKRSYLRRSLGVNSDELLVFLSVGMSFDPKTIERMKFFNSSKVKYLFSSNNSLKVDNSIIIPNTITETQNYLSACDLVISKAGYSTVAEAVTAKVPICLFKRTGFKEDELMEREIKRMGIGNIISRNCLLNGEWIQEFESLPNYKSHYCSLDERYKRNGTDEVVSALSEFIGDKL
jgi:uncharacterized protein (TIGR00661 family)